MKAERQEDHALIVLEYDKIRQKLAEFAVSANGRACCENLLPETDIEAIRSSLGETIDAEAILREKGSPPMQGLHDIMPMLARARLEATLSCAELLRIASFLGAAARLRRYVPEDVPEGNRVYGLMRRLLPLPSLTRRLNEAILAEDEVADTASPALAQIRRKQRQTQNDIRETLDRILRSQSNALQENLITQRSGRYVLPVKAECRSQISGVVHDASGSGATLFIEPMAVVRANNRMRELAAEEREEIERILTELSSHIADEADALQTDIAYLRQIDFAFAKGKLALKMQAHVPELNGEGEIDLRKARHPLIDPDQVVPIDLRMGHDFRTLVITGPNTGGKTAALKTLGLLTLMAQSGLAIPAAEGSGVAVFKRILADIGDEQSIEQNLSTFSAHMSQLVRICAEVDGSSLVLADELGSGTDPTEGAALAVALLDFFGQSGAITLATTHYKELKAYALQTPGVENACCEFDTETLRPTYKLLIGVPGVSNAFIISRRLGLPESIIEQAAGLISLDNQRFEELIREVEANHARAVRERESAEEELQAAKTLRAEIEAARSELELQRKGILADAREKTRGSLEEELEIIDAYLDELRELAANGDYREAVKRGEALRRDVKRRSREVEDEIGRATLSHQEQGLRAENIRAGEFYYAPAFNFLARALNEPDGRGQVSLQNGAMKIQVKAANLQPASAAPAGLREKIPVRSSRETRRVISERRRLFHAEIKLLGQTADEALANLDRYLDDAVLAGCFTVRVVHGKGTGVLRKAVSEHLKRDRRVRDFHLAAYGEGDSGVTIVELR